jgi:hypothetical protein
VIVSLLVSYKCHYLFFIDKDSKASKRFYRDKVNDVNQRLSPNSLLTFDQNQKHSNVVQKPVTPIRICTRRRYDAVSSNSKINQGMKNSKSVFNRATDDKQNNLLNEFKMFTTLGNQPEHKRSIHDVGRNSRREIAKSYINDNNISTSQIPKREEMTQRLNHIRPSYQENNEHLKIKIDDSASRPSRYRNKHFGKYKFV